MDNLRFVRLLLTLIKCDDILGKRAYRSLGWMGGWVAMWVVWGVLGGGVI